MLNQLLFWPGWPRIDSLVFAFIYQLLVGVGKGYPCTPFPVRWWISVLLLIIKAASRFHHNSFPYSGEEDALVPQLLQGRVLYFTPILKGMCSGVKQEGGGHSLAVFPFLATQDAFQDNNLVELLSLFLCTVNYIFKYYLPL